MAVVTSMQIEKSFSQAHQLRSLSPTFNLFHAEANDHAPVNLDADDRGAHFLPATLGVKRKMDDSDERTTLAKEKALPETAPLESSSDEEEDEDELEEEESEEEPVSIISFDSLHPIV